jgi:hypothetical protein
LGIIGCLSPIFNSMWCSMNRVLKWFGSSPLTARF